MKTRSILITGCSSGIGLCCALGMRDRGWRVFATARRDQDLALLESQGVEAIQLELGSSDSIAAAVSDVLRRSGGHIDALFNNAAYGQPGAVEDLRRDVLRRQFEVNLFGTHELTCQVLPAMRAQRHGRIVYNSSILGLIALPYRGAYNASKFALEGLVDTLRLELHGSGIALSLIEPGPIESRFRANALRHFKEAIDIAASPHAAYYQGVLARLEKSGPSAPFTLPPEAVLAKLVHATESRHPSPRYGVTLPTHLLGTLRRILPTRMLDALLLAISRNENG